MTFPTTPLEATFELWIDGAWVDVTGLVYDREGNTACSVTRGATDESGLTERGSCRLTANNESGDLSPRNPTGQYYGQIGRNTPMRVRVTPAADPYVLRTLTSADVTTPDSAGLSITGDIDIRVDVTREDWDSICRLAGKYETTGNQRSWAFFLNADKTLGVRWSNNGTATLERTSTAPVVAADGARLAVRVTIDVNNGAAGHDVKFYTAPTIDGSWTQLGSTVTTAGTTSIFDSTAPVEAGSAADVGSGGLLGKLHGFEVYQGIAGTLRGDLDHGGAVQPDSTSLTDSVGNLWTLAGGATVVDPAARFTGEISEWPQKWDTSGNDVFVPIEASGILRRLEQGTSALKSTLHRGYTSLATPPRAYWPCEDGEGATQLASALAGHPAMTLVGEPELASNTDFPSSSPLPVLSESEWTGVVPSYTNTGNLQVWLLVAIPEAGATNGQAIFSLYVASGSIHRWSLIYATGGGLALKAYDASGTELENGGTISFNLDGAPERLSLTLEENGSDVDWELIGQRLDGGVGGAGGTFTGRSVERATKVVVNPGGGLGDVAFGHVSVHDVVRSPFDLVEEFTAYAGEAAGRRIERLCAEEGIAVRAVGDTPATGPFDDSAAMGAQLPAALVGLLREAAAADGGILFEPRDMLGLAYRTRESLYHQDAALALDYSAGDLAYLEPVDDDQRTRNDVTVARQGGSSARAVREDGPLSVAAPPDGVGRYDEEVTLSLEADFVLEDRAGWLVHLGTVDEARYPLLVVNLAHANYTAAGGALALEAAALDVGDRVTVSDLPAGQPPGDVSQLALGFVEKLANYAWRIEMVCAPETPWGQAATYDADDARYSSDGTTLAEALDTTETSIDVSTPSGPVWDDTDAPFDVVVGGEVVTVAAVSGAGASQTFTGCTRSVNGVVKTHASGAQVELAHPSVYVI